jgi:hypothetical protein
MDIKNFYFKNMYLQPINGIAKGLFYNPYISPNLTMVLGNGNGSWGSLCYNISNNLSKKFIQIGITENNSINFISVYDGKNKKHIREIQALLGDNNKMEFVNGGEPLIFENTTYYKKHKISDRINKNILIEYAQKIGIDITDVNLFKLNEKSLYVELNDGIK